MFQEICSKCGRTKRLFRFGEYEPLCEYCDDQDNVIELTRDAELDVHTDNRAGVEEQEKVLTWSDIKFTKAYECWYCHKWIEFGKNHDCVDIIDANIIDVLPELPSGKVELEEDKPDVTPPCCG